MTRFVTGDSTAVSTSVATLAELGTLDDTPFADGEGAYIRQTKQYASLDRAASSGLVQTASRNGWWVTFFGGGSGGAGAGTVVYKPNAPSYGPNEYPTFALAYQASEPGGAIAIDTTYSQGEIGPAGAVYDMSERFGITGTLRIGFGQGPSSPVIIDDRVKLPGLRNVTGVITLLSQSSEPVVESTGTFASLVGNVLLLSEGSTLVGNGQVPFYSVPPNGYVGFIVCVLGGQLGDGQNVALGVGTGSIAQVIGYTSGHVEDNALQSAVGSQISVQFDDAGQASTHQPAVAGNIQYQLNSQADALGFDPQGLDPLWNDPSFSYQAPLMGPTANAAIQNLVRRANTFILRPGGVAGGCVFTDLTSLCQALSNLQGQAYEVQFDASQSGGSIVLSPPTSGNYSFPPNVRFTGNSGFGANPTTVFFGDGVQSQNDVQWSMPPGFAVKNLLLVNNNVQLTPLVFGAGESVLVEGSGVGGLTNSGPAAANAGSFLSSSNNQFELLLHDQWQLTGTVAPNGPRSILSLDAGSSATVNASDNVSIQTNALGAVTPGSMVVTLTGAASLSSTQASGTVRFPSLPSDPIVQKIGGTFAQPFTSQDLVQGLTPPATPYGEGLVVQHGLDTSAPAAVALYDESGNWRSVGGYCVVDSGTIHVDVTGYAGEIGAVPWTAVVRR